MSESATQEVTLGHPQGQAWPPARPLRHLGHQDTPGSASSTGVSARPLGVCGKHPTVPHAAQGTRSDQCPPQIPALPDARQREPLFSPAGWGGSCRCPGSCPETSAEGPAECQAGGQPHHTLPLTVQRPSARGGHNSSFNSCGSSARSPGREGTAPQRELPQKHLPGNPKSCAQGSCCPPCPPPEAVRPQPGQAGDSNSLPEAWF